MKKKQLRVVFVVVLLVTFSAIPAAAMEVTALFNIGNLGFAQNRTADDATFTGLSFPWGFSVALNQGITDAFNLS
ncbi:MAG: hypothetical protein AB1798_08640, partial [Spirochaetota bacterium]